MSELKSCVLIVCLAVASLSLARDDSEEMEIRDLLDAFLAGASVNDTQMHDRFWGGDLVYTSSSGARYGKAQIMASLSEPTTEGQESPVYSAEDVDIRLLDEVAIATFRLVANGPESGLDDQYYNTGVLVRRDGQWRAVTWHATRIPDFDE